MNPAMSRNGSDDFQTPPEAVLPLLSYLPDHWTIWECACGKGNLAGALRQAGRKVIDTDKKDGYDFLTWQPDHWHCTLSSPPFSLKNEFLARAYALGKPFAFLLPITSLETETRLRLFHGHGIQVMLFDKRIHFETPNQKTSHPWFPAAWFCWQLNLPKQMTFIDHDNEPVICATDVTVIDFEAVEATFDLLRDLSNVAALCGGLDKVIVLERFSIALHRNIYVGTNLGYPFP